METTISTRAMPRSVRVLAALGIAWNGFGIVQWSGQTFASPAVLVAKGMTPAQAALYAALPGWMTIVFAIGVFGGLAGSILLAIGRRAALTALGMSLLGYIALFVGDIVERVFAAFGLPHMLVLMIVVAIATGLLLLALHADRRAWLR